MTGQEFTPAASAPQGLNRTLVWTGAIGLMLGLTVLGWLGSFGSLGLGFLLALTGPVYGVVTLIVRRRLARRTPVAPEPAAGSYRSAHFAAPAQVLALTSEVALLVATVALGITLLLAALQPVPSGSSYVINAMGFNSYLAAAPIPVFALMALIAGSITHYGSRTLAGERWALETGQGAAKLIRFARGLNLAVIWLFTVLGFALVIYTVVDQVLTLNYINHYNDTYNCQQYQQCSGKS